MNSPDTRVTLPIRCSMVSVVTLSADGAGTRVLLLHRASTYLRGVWSYVAGHIEAGEAGWQTALRELAEETGLTPYALYSSGFTEQFYNALDDCIEVVPGFVALVQDHAQVHLNREHDEFRWLPIDEAMPILPFESQRSLFAHVRREFIDHPPPIHLRMPAG